MIMYLCTMCSVMGVCHKGISMHDARIPHVERWYMRDCFYLFLPFPSPAFLLWYTLIPVSRQCFNPRLKPADLGNN